MAEPVRRKFVRLKVFRDVKAAISGRAYSGFITDEGGGGVFVEVKGKFRVGDNARLTYVTHQSVQVSRNGKIVRVEPNGFAVQFDDPRYAR